MNELTDERLAELRTIAESAQDLSPAAWGMDDGIDWDYRVMAGDQYLADTGDAGVTAHIAAFQPSTVLALLDEVERLRAQLTITDEMVKRGALAMHRITCDTNWHECSHAGPAGCMAITRQVLEAALGGEKR